MMHVAGYKQLEKIAEGPDRLIYGGIREDGQEVIIKALRSEHPSTDMIALMYHEYELCKDLTQVEGVIQTFGLIVQQNQYALVQENTHGISLHDYLHHNPIKDLSLFCTLALQMVEIIGEIHRRHIIHKDIKPGNFIFHPNNLTIKLTDFNFSSKLLHEVQDIVPPGRLEGTLAYMAPEQTGRMNMNIDYRSDFYALGVTFYEMLTSRLPFSSFDPLELVHAHLTSVVPDVESDLVTIPPILDGIVKKLMAKNPAHRYQSTMGIIADLELMEQELKNPAPSESFDLGAHDVFDRLNLSQKLYGREREAQVLLSAYERVSQGNVEALMVCGYSGIGKTMLINEVHKPMVQHKGYFISGKFDQLQRNTPYTAVTQAFNQLARLILTEPEARFEAIKTELQQALGTVGQVIIDLAPDMELIIGPQPPLEKLHPNETQNRMMTFFKRFVNVIANREHPLVLFIDDLQWIDSGSLKLFEYILTDDELSCLLLIGAYRDNEVDDGHPLCAFLNAMEKRRITIASLALDPLTSANFVELFKDSFKREKKTIRPLAELIHKRTEGNPFFCKQVINTLYQEDLLYFDYDTHQWEWNLEGITALKITDNVVDLMLTKLLTLPESTRELLKFAACIGNRFTIERLALVSDMSPEDVGKALWPALQEELIITLRLGYKRVEAIRHEALTELLSKDITYQFVHDRIQQAVYSVLSPEEKQKTHLTIARLLMIKEPEACRKDRLFEVTDHYNEAPNLLDDLEKKRVVELNYQACIRAQKANAYQPMENYIRAAKKLMDDGWWSDNYDLTYNIHLEEAMALLLLNKDNELELFVDTVLNSVRTDFERVALYRILISSNHKMSNFDKVFELAQTALALLGIAFNIKPRKPDVLMGFLKVRWEMRRFNLETLDQELPRMTDKKIILAFEIFLELMSPSIFRGPESFGYLLSKTTALILQYGKSENAGVWIAGYGMLLYFIFNNVTSCFAYWNVAERLTEESTDRYSAAETYHLYALFVSHVRNHYKEGLVYLQKTREDATLSGNIIKVAYADGISSLTKLAEANSLQDTLIAVKSALKSFNSANLNELAIWMTVWSTAFENLSKNNSDEFLPLHDADYQEKLSLITNPLLHSEFYKTLFCYYYFLEDFDKADYYYQLWMPLEPLIHFEPMIHELKMMYAMLLAQKIPTESGLVKWNHEREFKRFVKEFKWCARNNPVNFLHHYLFLKGTQAKLKGRIQDAVKAYDKAIVNAKKGDFHLWVAFGNELAGDMLVEQKQKRSAIDYIREARYYYDRYGINIKANAIEARYPYCFIEYKESTPRPFARSSLQTSSNTDNLDFLSVIKASQTISGEIVLDQLFEKMLHIITENAGAERALFLELHKDNWDVTARFDNTLDDDKFAMLNHSLKDYQDLPHSMVQYVLRSQETIVLSNAAEDTKYRQDPYIIKMQPKSVLCLPVLHHDKVTGVIYLENNKTIGAFTQNRVLVLRTLTSQIAISLENARHFDEMESINRSTQRFVPKKFLEILHRKTIQEIQLGDSLRLKVSILFADIRKFTTLLERLDPETAFGFVNRYLAITAPVIRDNSGFITQYQGDGILAVFPGPTDDAVNAGIAMFAGLKKFNDQQIKDNGPVLNIGVGINSGSAMMGIIGEKERLEPAVVSDITNTAARLETLNLTYGTHFLISGHTYDALEHKDRYKIRTIDKVKLKGKSDTTLLYEIIDWEEQLVDISLPEYLALFNQAFAEYESGNFASAQEQFTKCLNYRAQDQVITTLMQRCAEFIEKSPPANWDGIYTMMHK